MSLNPFSEAPWVISVAASTLDHHRGDFSSNGLIYDNSQPGQVGGGGHTVYSGDRIGVYHPDVTAPGQSISSTCSTAGTAVLACPPYGNRTASGTSMASPHVAGAAAVLRQANPLLTPDEVRSALQATATPVFAADGSALPFWQIGFGHVDLAAAAALVQSHGNWRKSLARAQAKADSRVLAADGFAVRASDFWTYDAPRLAIGGSDQRTFSTVVGLATTHLKVTLSHPSLAVVGENGMEYTVTVRDAGGQPLGTTTEAPTGAGTASLFVDLGALGFTVVPGEFTFEVSGELALSDPDTLDSESLLGRMVTLQVAQLRRD
jgi:serine protease AprX